MDTGATGGPIFVSIQEAQRLTGLRRTTLLGLVYEGAIPSVKVGARRLLPAAGLQEWADRLVQEQVKSRHDGVGAGR